MEKEGSMIIGGTVVVTVTVEGANVRVTSKVAEEVTVTKVVVSKRVIVVLWKDEQSALREA